MGLFDQKYCRLANWRKLRIWLTTVLGQISTAGDWFQMQQAFSFNTVCGLSLACKPLLQGSRRDVGPQELKHWKHWELWHWPKAGRFVLGAPVSQWEISVDGMISESPNALQISVALQWHRASVFLTCCKQLFSDLGRFGEFHCHIVLGIPVCAIQCLRGTPFSELLVLDMSVKELPNSSALQFGEFG